MDVSTHSPVDCKNSSRTQSMVRLWEQRRVWDHPNDSYGWHPHLHDDYHDFHIHHTQRDDHYCNYYGYNSYKNEEYSLKIFKEAKFYILIRLKLISQSRRKFFMTSQNQ